MKQNLDDDQKFNQRLAEYYQRAIDGINRTIDENATLIVDENGNHTGYQPVTAGQMAAYQREAKHVVEQAIQMRVQGQTPTYGDWSDNVNRRMRVYNATMRINRLELLKSQVGVHLTEATAETDKALTAKLSDDYIKECQRQAGIMEVTTQPSMWTSSKVAKIVMAQTNSATFSDRLWANQDALKAKLDVVISDGIIQGQSPSKMARRLKSEVKDTVTNQRYVAERIARTESARVQFTAQMNSIKANGYEYVQWFTEIKACPECQAIERKDNGWGPGIYKISKVPEIPVHPNCRCAISETVPETDKIGQPLTWHEKAALKRYVSSNSYKINDALRRNDFTPEDREEIGYLDEALLKIPIYVGQKILYRTFDFHKDRQRTFDFANNIVTSNFYVDSAYVSTSKSIYDDKNNDLTLIIKKSKHGRDLDVSSYNVGEQEVLFPRNSLFKVEGFGISNGNDYGLPKGKPYIVVTEGTANE